MNRSLVFLLALLVIGVVAGQAAPFAERVTFTQPDRTQIELYGQGDEFYAVFETLDGYTVAFVPATKTYHYAKLSPDGNTLQPVGPPVGKVDPSQLGLTKHQRLSPATRRQQARTRQQEWEAAMDVSRRWEALKARQRQLAAGEASGTDVGVLSPPSSTTTGTKIGLCLLIDFSDDPATIPQASVQDFLNSDSYTGYGNNGSIKKYFLDNSNNLLAYTNVVTIYIRMALPKAYYNDTSKSCGTQGRLLITDAVNIMKALPNYNTEILPTFDALTVDGSNRIIALNVFYAGGNGGVWSYGLWPHSSSISGVELSPTRKLYRYQLTNMASSLQLGTFCHENGHMLCGFPDIYDYDYDSTGGAGVFCLMNSGGHGTNPKQICAYLKRAAGWATTIELTGTSFGTGSLTANMGSDFNRFYRYQKPGVPTEYFLVENRQKIGRDSGLPAAGIAIWHIDEYGNKDNQSTNYNTSHLNYEVSLMQADNLWHFQNYVNSGDANDLYHAGNSAAGYANQFNDTTGPPARWWDGSNSGIDFNSFSANGSNMTFNIGADAFLVTPPSDATFAGMEGIPLNPTCLTYVLTNRGPTAINWTATNTAPWLIVSVTNGTLAASNSLSATFCLDPSTLGFPTGVYTDSVTFSNRVSARTQVRAVTLTITGVYVSWTNNTGSAWQDAVNWSPNRAPSNSQWGVYVTNAISKTVLINADAPTETLTISNLTVAAPAPYTNTLRITDATLRLLNAATFTTGGRLEITNGTFLVESGIYQLDGLAFINPGGSLLATGTQSYVGRTATGTLTVNGGSAQFRNLTVSETGYGTIWVNSGTCLVQNVSIIASNATGQVIVSNGLFQAGSITMGYGSSGHGTLTISGGTTWFTSTVYAARTAGSTADIWLRDGDWLTTNTTFYLGYAGTGRVTVSNGCWRATTTYLGYNANSTGTLWIAGGQVTFTNGTATTYIGRAGSGQLTIANGQFRARAVTLGSAAGGRGALTVAGGTNAITTTLIAGNTANSTGAIWITGGLLAVTNGATTIANAGNGQLTVSNGSLLLRNVSLAVSNTPGTLTAAGGVTICTSNLVVGNCADGGVGQVRISGGALFITNAAHNATLDLRGGTLTISAGSLTVDRLVITNGCAFFVQTGGTFTMNNPPLLGAGLDTDGDGLPNDWETANGLNPLSPAGDGEANLDADHDGFTNLQEYIAGTNPQDATSRLAITECAPNPAIPDEFILRWSSVAGRTYTLQAATNLTTGFNLILATGIPATPPSNVYTDTVTGVGMKFYRIKVE